MRRIVAASPEVGGRALLALDVTVSLVVLALVAAPMAGPVGEGARPAGPSAYLLAAAVALPYVAHRRWPLLALATSSLAVVVYSTGHYEGYPGFASFAMVFGLALHASRATSAIGYVVSLATLSLALALQPRSLVDLSSWFTSLLVLTVAWLAGENVRAHRARLSALQERAHRLELEREERARQAVEEERMRIARDLHDVVAHSMSVIAVQAGVAHHVIDARPELAKQALGTIETSARSALAELRRMLGLLRRNSGTDGPLTPAPGLTDLHTLCAGFEDAGLAVRVEVTGDPSSVPAGLQLSAYRIVQESLTNTFKHGGSTASVHVDISSDGVQIDVVDAEPLRPASASPAGAGHGLIGMRERVALFHGRFEAGPDASGGFRVHATLPTGPMAPVPPTAAAAREPRS